MDLDLAWAERNGTTQRFLEFHLDGQPLSELHNLDLISCLGWFAPEQDHLAAQRLLGEAPPDIDDRVSLHVCPECSDIFCGASRPESPTPTRKSPGQTSPTPGTTPTPPNGTTTPSTPNPSTTSTPPPTTKPSPTDRAEHLVGSRFCCLAGGVVVLGAAEGEGAEGAVVTGWAVGLREASPGDQVA